MSPDPVHPAAPRHGAGAALGCEQGWLHPAWLLGQDPLSPHCAAPAKGLWPSSEASSGCTCPAGSGAEGSAQERDPAAEHHPLCLCPEFLGFPRFPSCFSSSPRPWFLPVLLFPACPAAVDQWGIAESSELPDPKGAVGVCRVPKVPALVLGPLRAVVAAESWPRTGYRSLSCVMGHRGVTISREPFALKNPQSKARDGGTNHIWLAAVCMC